MRPSRHVVHLVAEVEHCSLVRDRDVRPCEADRDEPAKGLAEPIGLARKRNVGPVEPAGGERGILDPGWSECETG